MALNQIAGGKACYHQVSEARYNRTVVVGQTISVVADNEYVGSTVDALVVRDVDR